MCVKVVTMKKHEKLVLYMHAQIRSTSGSSKESVEAGGRLGSNGRAKGKGGVLSPLPPKTFFQRFLCLLLTILLRRHAVLLLAPLFYVSGMLLYMGDGLSFKTSSHPLSTPGSLYRGPDAFIRFWPQMQLQDDSSSFSVLNAWLHGDKQGYCWKPCLDGLNSSTGLLGLQESNGFIIIEANGGLNQQRSSICNAVALAGLLNATLMIPKFHFNSVWKDASSFSEIYNEEEFIRSLADHVRVVKEIPDYIMQRFEYNYSLIHNFKVEAWAPAAFYQEKVLPKLLEDGVIRIAPFANRLSYGEIPSRIQQLRCFANFESLRFADTIAAVGEKLALRMKERSAKYDGKYVAVHLRFEEDMVAFSCCIYDGGEEEQQELDAARERGWRGKFRKPGRVINPGANRMNGKCPMTPIEVGMMLRGMGFQNDTPIFIAAGKVYNAEKSMAPLYQMFPFLYTKEMLLSEEELEPFKNFSSRLAALDYTVCLESEVFVTTQGGNFPQFLIGHRRYLHNGHAKTIKPDKRKLAVLLDTPAISWKTFEDEMQAMRYHSDVKGHEVRKASASIYTYPAPDCLCSQQDTLAA